MKKIVAWHISAWMFVFALFMFPVFFNGFRANSVFLLISLLSYIASFYINIVWILPIWIRRRNIFGLLLRWFGLILLYTLFSFFLYHLFYISGKNGRTGIELFNAFFRSCLFVGFFIFLSSSYQSIMDWFKNERIQQQLENQNLQTELAFLKTQINPHFLFNTLNNIYILAYQRSEKTADAVLKLSGIMQYMLYESGDEWVPLQKEIEYIRQLMALQQLRIKDSMCFNLAITGVTEKHLIAPLILIAFIENIFKHGVLDDPLYPATVQISVTGNTLTFQSHNRIHSYEKTLTSGIGLPNVQRRMQLLYPDKHHFSVTQDEHNYSIFLTINLA